MGYVLMLAYLALMLMATKFFTRQETTVEGFNVSNRGLGTWQSAMSIAATWIWAPALFVSAEKAYVNGWVGLFWFLVPNVLCLLLFIPFAKEIRRRMPGGITLSGFMGKSYGSEGVKKTYLAQLGLLSILSTAVQLLAGGKILSTMAGTDFTTTTILLAGIAYAYSYKAGIKASVITDALQMVMILTACFVFVTWAISINGFDSIVSGIGGASGKYTSLFSTSGVELFLAFGLPTAIGLISGPFGDQCFWQRAFSVEEKKLTKAFGLGAALFGLVPLSMGLLGFMAAGTGYIPHDKGIVNLELVTALFPAWVTYPFMFMLISGLLSTVDSNLCAVASLTSDYTKDLQTAKRYMVILLLLGISIANVSGLTVTHLFLIYGILRATTLLPTALTLMGVKLSAKGVIIGVTAGLCVGLPIFAAGVFKNVLAYRLVGCIMTPLVAGLIATRPFDDCEDK